MFDLDDFLSRCREAVVQPSPALAVKQVVERALRERPDVASSFGRPAIAALTPLYSSEDLVVLHAVWAPGMRVPPHDHRTWAVIGIYGGDEDNAFYRREQGSILEIGGRSVHEGEVVVLGPEVIHAVTNPRTQSFTGAIHVYGGPYLNAPRSMWSEPELTERPVSLATTQAIFEAANRTLDAAEQRLSSPG